MTYINVIDICVYACTHTYTQLISHITKGNVLVKFLPPRQANPTRVEVVTGAWPDLNSEIIIFSSQSPFCPCFLFWLTGVVQLGFV